MVPSRLLPDEDRGRGGLWMEGSRHDTHVNRVYLRCVPGSVVSGNDACHARHRGTPPFEISVSSRVEIAERQVANLRKLMEIYLD